jgi:ribokinase
MIRVLCLGDVMVDILTRLHAPLQVGSDTPADVRWTGGGSAANTAAWLVAAELESGFLGRVGADIPGQAALDGLREGGVDVHASVDPTLATGTCVVLVDDRAERTMIPSAGANAALSAADVDAVALDAFQHLHVSGYALFGGGRDAALHAMERARAAGLSLSIGAASSAPLRAAGAEQFLTWAAETLLFANRDEAEVLTGSADVEQSVRMIAGRTGQAVVTAGARGAAWSDGTSVITAAAESVEVVDSTGAGDAFAAGFLAARFGRAAPEVALAFAHGLSARACQVVGGRPITARTRGRWRSARP